MKNLIKGGTPTGFNDLLQWTYEQVSYQLDVLSNTGFYRLKAGHLTQRIHNKILKNETLDVRCSYKSTNVNKKRLGTIYVNLVYDDNSTDVMLIPLTYNDFEQSKGYWITTKQTCVSSEDKSVKYVDIRINADYDVILDVTELAIYYSGSDESNNLYDNNEFQDKSILYGFDKDKPKLR